MQICQWYRVCDAGALRAEPLATLYILRGQNIETEKRSFKNKNRKEQGKEIARGGGAVTPKGCVCVANN